MANPKINNPITTVKILVIVLFMVYAPDADYIYKSFALTADADNIENFKIRFSCTANGATERCLLDNVQVSGTENIF